MHKRGDNRFSALAQRLIELPRPAKQFIMQAADAILLPCCLWAAIALQLNRVLVPVDAVPLFIASALGALLVFWAMGLYRSVIRFIGPQPMVATIVGITVSAGVA